MKTQEQIEAKLEQRQTLANVYAFDDPNRLKGLSVREAAKLEGQVEALQWVLKEKENE